MELNHHSATLLDSVRVCHLAKGCLNHHLDFSHIWTLLIRVVRRIVVIRSECYRALIVNGVVLV